jgi:hypothetical protein
VVARPCEASWELVDSWLVCVAPLRLGGLRGKKSTPSIGWEVPVKSRRSASGSCMERARHQLRAGDQATIHFLYFCMVDCSRIYALDLHV